MAIFRGNIGQNFPVVFRYFRFGIVYLAFIYYVRAWITSPPHIYPHVCYRSEVILTPDYASSVLRLGAHDCSLGLIYPVNMRLNLAVSVPLIALAFKVILAFLWIAAAIRRRTGAQAVTSDRLLPRAICQKVFLHKKNGRCKSGNHALVQSKIHRFFLPMIVLVSR